MALGSWTTVSVGLSIEAAQWLLTNRKIGGMGTDTICLDYGPGLAFPVHVAMSEENLISKYTSNCSKVTPYFTHGGISVCHGLLSRLF